jgi:glycosyltransferase involved in cell wall biosynthesis
MAAASVYLQPSLMESFSRSIMEAWLAGTPVLARTGSEVVHWHLEQSRGGEEFDSALDLARALRGLVEDPASAGAMAARGRRYVLANYTWPPVLDRIEAELNTDDRTDGRRHGGGPYSCQRWS